MQCRPTNFDIAHQALGKPPEGKRMAEVDDLVGTRVEIARCVGLRRTSKTEDYMSGTVGVLQTQQLTKDGLSDHVWN
jgi:hypothetical protein